MRAPRAAPFALVAALALLAPRATAGVDAQLERAMQALARDPSLKVRTQAALVIGQRGAREGVGALAHALQEDRAVAVRAAAAAALGRIGSGASLDGAVALRQASQRDPDPAVRDQQAVALKTQADRIELRNVRLLGHQDTLYANAPRGRVARQYFRDCYIEGDVDFIFGSATAAFDRCTIRALDRAGPASYGCVTAASTADTVPFGFLIVGSRIESDAPPQTVHLGRPWHPGRDPRACAQVVVRDTWLATAIAAEPWTDMSGFSWHDARFFEHRNTGPGAAAGASRPQLAATDVASFTARTYLAGGDGWDPATAG